MSPPDERAGSQAEGPLPLWHLQERIEKLYTEVTLMRAAQAETNLKVDKKLVEHEFQHTQTKDSLNAGNARFSGMEAKIMPRWSTIAAVLAVAGTLIWTASRYPDQSKFEDLQKQFNSLQGEQIEGKRDVADLRKDNQRMEQKMDSIEGKLDRLLLQKP